MEERYHASTQNRFYPDMSNVNKNITLEAKLISPPTCVCVCVCIYIYIHTHIYRHTHTHIYIYTHIHIYIYIYIYINVNLQIQKTTNNKCTKLDNCMKCYCLQRCS